MPDSNATINREQLLRAAFRRIGKDNPSVNDLALGVQTLNDVCKRLDSRGRWLTAISNSPTALTLVAGQASYAVGSTATTIANYMLELERVEKLSGTTIEYELTILDKTGAISTPLRSGNVTPGEPLEVYLERAPNPSNQKMWFYPTPSSAFSVQYYFRRRLYDFDNSTDNPDLPQEHNIGLQKILANELAPQYGVPIAEITGYHEPLARNAEIEMLAANSDKIIPSVMPTHYF